MGNISWRNKKIWILFGWQKKKKNAFNIWSYDNSQKDLYSLMADLHMKYQDLLAMENKDIWKSVTCCSCYWHFKRSVSYCVGCQTIIQTLNVRRKYFVVFLFRFEQKLEDSNKNYNPWGRGGGGAPIKGASGEPIGMYNFITTAVKLQ